MVEIEPIGTGTARTGIRELEAEPEPQEPEPEPEPEPDYMVSYDFIWVSYDFL